MNPSVPVMLFDLLKLRKFPWVQIQDREIHLQRQIPLNIILIIAANYLFINHTD